MGELLLKEEVFAIIGAAMDVHSALGPGFLEAVYHEAMALELGQRGIPYESEKPLRICYKGRVLEKTYVADFLCYGQVVVELKATARLTSQDEGQLLNYLKATGLRVGILVNFGRFGKLEWKRMVR